MSENLITNIDIQEESKNCFLTYTEEVLTDRAVPNIEDGLLSVHRKLIWTMESILKMNSKSKFKKSASIVGSTLASSYFHGDAACYGALCKIGQPYLMRYPLIEGDGNIGTQEGNGMEAASRYTNARPSQFSDIMMQDFNKNTVPLKETYNGEYMEPVFLPSLFPNAICNGRETIAVGMAHSSLPNNLTEVCNGIIAYLKNKNITVKELMQYIPGPDFPLHNVVINKDDIYNNFLTGHGTTIKVRGNYIIQGNDIIFDTIPYRTYRNKIKEQINKNIDELDSLFDDFRDESNVGQNKLIFTVKKGINPTQAVNKLFALTDLQTSVSYNMNFIVNGTPKMCSLLDLIHYYVEHQYDVMIHRSEFDKDKAEKRIHILEGLLLAVDKIDEVITLIRKSNDKAAAKAGLVDLLTIDEIQAQAILDMKLGRLTKIDKEELIQEKKEKESIVQYCIRIINDIDFRDNELIKEIINMRDKYGDERRTELIQIDVKPEEKEVAEVIPEDVVIIMTKAGNIKRIPKNNFRIQKRNGKGIKTADDVILNAISTNTIDSLMIFTNKGKMYRLLVDKIPVGTNATKGTAISSLLRMDMDETVEVISSINRKNDYRYAVFFTKLGMIKKTSLKEFMSAKRTTGIAAIKFKENDSLANVVFMNDEEVLVVTKHGLSIRFNSSDITPVGRAAAGVRAIKLADNDEVLMGTPITDDYVGVFTKNGLGKIMKITEFPNQLRGGKGIYISKISASTGELVSANMLNKSDTVLLTGKPNSICVAVAEMPLLSRISVGNTMIQNSKIEKVMKL